MQKEHPQKLLFIINPVSGGKGKEDWEQFIRGFFQDQPHQSEFFLLSGANDSVSILHYLDTIKPDKVVAVGGDGTVKLVAELLKGTDYTLGILPAGSANGMAREMGLPLDRTEAMEVLLYGQEKAIDVIAVNEQEICIHLADLGLNAMLVKYFDESPGRGMWGYGRSLLKVLWNKRVIRAQLQTDKGTINRRAYMIVLANARMYGTGVTINPKGDLQDGKFEVVIVRSLNFWAIVKVLTSNKNFPEEHIEVHSITNLKISTRHKAYFQVDGEYRGRTKEVHARVMPRSLKVMLPIANDQPV